MGLPADARGGMSGDACGSPLAGDRLAWPRCDEPTGGPTDGTQCSQSMCATCHGPTRQAAGRDGRAARRQDLTRAGVPRAGHAELVEHQVRNGSKNKLMPAFEGALSDAQIKAVAAYVASPAVSRAASELGARRSGSSVVVRRQRRRRAELRRAPTPRARGRARARSASSATSAGIARGRAGVAERDRDVAEQHVARHAAQRGALDELAQLVRALARRARRDRAARARRERGASSGSGGSPAPALNGQTSWQTSQPNTHVPIARAARAGSRRGARSSGTRCSGARRARTRRRTRCVGHASRHARHAAAARLRRRVGRGRRELGVDEQLAEHDVAAERRARSASCSSRRSRGRRARPTRARAPARSRRTAGSRPARPSSCGEPIGERDEAIAHHEVVVLAAGVASDPAAQQRDRPAPDRRGRRRARRRRASARSRAARADRRAARRARASRGTPSRRRGRRRASSRTARGGAAARSGRSRRDGSRARARARAITSPRRCLRDRRRRARRRSRRRRTATVQSRSRGCGYVDARAAIRRAR